MTEEEFRKFIRENNMRTANDVLTDEQKAEFAAGGGLTMEEAERLLSYIIDISARIPDEDLS